MAGQAEAVGTEHEAPKTAPSAAGRPRFSTPLIVASAIMFISIVLFFVKGAFLLVDIGLFAGGHGIVPTVLGVLTPEGRLLILGAGYLFVGAVALAIFVAFLFRRRWAWSAAMTWVALGLLTGLIAYSLGRPGYLAMLWSVILLFALNQAALRREFRIGVEPREVEAATAPSEVPAAPSYPPLSARADATDLELLRTFEPVVRFTQGEQFFPTDVERYVSQASLWAHYPDQREEKLIDAGKLDVERLVEPRAYPFGTIEFLQLNETVGVAEGARVISEVKRQRIETGNTFESGRGRLARGGFLPRIVDAGFSVSFFIRGKVSLATAAAAELDYNRDMKEDEKYVYYGRVTRQSGWTILQYWFFYYYNSWRSGFHGVNDHESDWENIIVYLYEDEGRLHPEWAAYASHDFHGGDLRRRWDDQAELDLVDGHPVVWAGAGSHASYFRQGEYQSSVELPFPKWVHSVARGLSSFWTRTLGQPARSRDPLRIPFVDFARGDGKSIGPGQQCQWSPVVVDESTLWVAQYRGLWGLYAHDPISGENAPAGPMYNRGGSPRQSWYDPLGFAGLDKEPPPPDVPGLLLEDCSRVERDQEELQRLIGERSLEVQAVGVELAGLEGNPHLDAQHRDLLDRSAGLERELDGLRKRFSENQAVLAALRQKLALLQEGKKPDARAHIHKLGTPVAPREVRFNRAAEAWGAVSLSIILLGIVAILVLARGYVWMALVLMVVAFVIIESILRAEFARTITGIAAILAVVAAILLLGHYWFWVIIVLLASLAVFLMAQKLRELRR